VGKDVTVKIYTDGSHCRMGSGWAAVIVVDDVKAALIGGYKFLPTATAAELTAIYQGLNWSMNRDMREVVILTDSQKATALLTKLDATTPEITEARIAKLILQAISACTDVQIRCICGDKKHSPDHRLWHRMVDSLSRQNARTLNRMTLAKIASGEIGISRETEKKLTRRINLQ
jgi:ribonuclease HI